MAIIISEHDGQVVVGTEEDDNLNAIHNNVVLEGRGGTDVLVSDGTVDGTIMDGGAGGDILAGGGTNDTASYASASAGVSVDLFAGGASDGDLLLGIENVTGSAFNDTLTGDPGANVLQGAGGDDVLSGDVFGIESADTFKYSFTFTPGEAEKFTFTEFFAERGGSVVNGEVADGTSMGLFASSYAHWLKMLVKEEGLGTGGMRDLTQFGEPENFTWKAGHGKKAVTHEVSYFDTWTKGGGVDSVASNDGLDTILDFSMDDMLDFSGITEEQFLAHFNADSSGSAAGDASLNDTVLTINGVSNWSLTLADVSLSLTQVADQTAFS